ncbi:titin, partial [Trichonephila inaurata madagascariensis]
EIAGLTIPTKDHVEISEVKSEIKPGEVAVEKIPRSVKADVTMPATEHIIVSETESNLQAKEFSISLPKADKAKQTLAVKEPIKIDEIPGEVSIEQQVTLTDKKEKPIQKQKGNLDFIDVVYEEAAEFTIERPEEKVVELIEETSSTISLVKDIPKPKKPVEEKIREEFSPFTVTLPEEETTEESIEDSVTKTRTVKVVHKKMKDGKIAEVKEIVETFSSIPKSKPTIEDVTESDIVVLESEEGKQPIIEEFEDQPSLKPEEFEQPEELQAVVQEEIVEEKDEVGVTLKKKPKLKKESKPVIKTDSSEDETFETTITLKEKNIVEEIEVIPAVKDETESDKEEQIILIPQIEKVVDDVEILIEGSEDILPTVEAKVRREGPEVFISEMHETKTEQPIQRKKSIPKEDSEVTTKVTIKKQKKPKEDVTEESPKDDTSETSAVVSLKKRKEVSPEKPKEEMSEVSDVKIKFKKKPKEDTKVSLEVTKPEEMPESMVVSLKSKGDKVEEIFESSIERKPSKESKITITKQEKIETSFSETELIVEEHKIETIFSDLPESKQFLTSEKQSPDAATISEIKEEEIKPDEEIPERKPSLKEEETEATDKATLKLKKKSKKEDKPEEVKIEIKPSQEEKKPEEVTEIKIKKKSKPEEKPEEVKIEIKPSKEEEKPEEVTEIKIKKKSKPEEKPEEVKIEIKPSKEEKPEEVTEIKIKKKPKPEEKPEEVKVEIKPTKEEEKPEEVTEIKIKKKPKKDEKP